MWLLVPVLIWLAGYSVALVAGAEPWSFVGGYLLGLVVAVVIEATR